MAMEAPATALPEASSARIHGFENATCSKSGLLAPDTLSASEADRYAKAIRDLMEAACPQYAFTLRFGEHTPWDEVKARGIIRHLEAWFNSQLLGPRWQRPNNQHKLTTIICIPEAMHGTNPHLHGVIHVHDSLVDRVSSLFTGDINKKTQKPCFWVDVKDRHFPASDCMVEKLYDDNRWMHYSAKDVAQYHAWKGEYPPTIMSA
ncbi:hypothetical protein [Fodinicurvata sp. EGI_FJ10296]|uniref:hypothetical protein n=1 Tax=Fodinicurvata sp. EGI_FJ10296 TaxID=3231908 RepID=UPI0034560F89